MRKTILAAVFTVFLGALSCVSGALAQPGPQVVVSIKPIHALVAGVMQGIAEPQLLVKTGGSPHGYALRPSETRALANAELVVWIGPSLESFLEKPLATLARQAQQLELTKALRDQLLPARKAGSWDGHAHAAAHQEHSESEGEGNPHLWLSPLLAKQIVAQTEAALRKIDPGNTAAYRLNAERLQQRLDALHQHLSDQLAPVNAVPYIVFHDAYQYFETAYGLNPIGSLSVDPERKPGAKRISEIRAKIKALNARCVFSEPQFEPRLVATIIEGTDTRTGILDPLGADLPAGTESYFLLLNNLAKNLLAGLR